jgi:tripartite-type tricarboxylate transporter receptor subunit TctC
LRQLEVYSWQAAAAPMGLAPDVRAKLEAELIASAKSPDVVARFDDIGFEGVASNGVEFGKFLEAEIARWKTVIEVGNISAN